MLNLDTAATHAITFSGSNTCPAESDMFLMLTEFAFELRSALLSFHKSWDEMSSNTSVAWDKSAHAGRAGTELRN